MRRSDLIAELAELVARLARGACTSAEAAQALRAAADRLSSPLGPAAAAADFTLTPPTALEDKRAEQRRAREAEIDAVVQRVFDYWRTTFGKPSSTKLTDERRNAVRKRLRGGATEAMIRQAIRGCAESDHHSGLNDRGRAYNDLELICRNDTKLEQFMEMASPEAVTRGGDVVSLEDLEAAVEALEEAR